MQEMVNIYVYGKKYSVPGDLTIMTAMEYAGYQLNADADAVTDSAVHVRPSTESKERMS